MSLSLTQETLAKVDQVSDRFPERRSAMLPVLHLVQEEQGYISSEAIEWIAARLDLEPINVYEVVTFYPGFRQSPPGRRIIRVCRTLPCALRGSYKTCEAFLDELGCELGGNSPDGEATVEFVECLASCGTAPVVLIDEDLHENVDAARARELARAIREGVPASGEAAVSANNS